MKTKKLDHCAHIGAYYCESCDQIKSARTYFALTVWTTNIHKIKIGGLTEALEILRLLIHQTKRAHHYIKKSGGIYYEGNLQ